MNDINLDTLEKEVAINFDYDKAKYINQALQEKQKNDTMNEFLKKEYDSNCTQAEIVQLYINYLKSDEKDGVLKGFRILTNEDKEDYENWKREKQEREKGCEYCNDFSFIQKGYFVDNSKSEILGINNCCINCGRDLRRVKIMSKYDEAKYAINNAPIWGDDEFNIHLDVAVEVLQQAKERENPQPLTLEQLKERVGKPIWDSFKKEWFILNDLFEDEETKNIDWLEATDEVFHGFNIDEHRYYDHEPKGEN